MTTIIIDLSYDNGGENNENDKMIIVVGIITVMISATMRVRIKRRKATYLLLCLTPNIYRQIDFKT